ncbi:uncharacterized protein LOC110350367 [Heterocephalus glaber]|uniref:Uncharacterized protein LOC110350367 n=1 Tax=Heterocephalus glaber TaxID=10181 RepID=A0AAX6TDB8_HETGA|nr:uncharacterized protein LOC110350367 [Heterocephalus glaber]
MGNRRSPRGLSGGWIGRGRYSGAGSVCPGVPGLEGSGASEADSAGGREARPWPQQRLPDTRGGGRSHRRRRQRGNREEGNLRQEEAGSRPACLTTNQKNHRTEAAAVCSRLPTALVCMGRASAPFAGEVGARAEGRTRRQGRAAVDSGRRLPRTDELSAFRAQRHALPRGTAGTLPVSGVRTLTRERRLSAHLLSFTSQADAVTRSL